jgi:hypothetical protein
MGINYKGSQDQTERTVALQEDEDQIKMNEVGRACGMNGTADKCTWFWWKSLKERDH